MGGAVIGIDQSARHSGVAVLGEGGELLCLAPIKPPKTLRGAGRLKYIHDQLTDICTQHGPFCAAALEDYSFGSVHRRFTLGEVGGVARLTLAQHAARVVAISPKGLKKFSAGFGGAKKRDIMAAVSARWGIVTKDDNLADAYSLAQVAYALVYAPTGLSRAAVEALRAVSEG